MTEQEMKEYIDSLERELYGYRKLGTQSKIKAALRRDSKARRRKKTPSFGVLRKFRSYSVSSSPFGYFSVGWKSPFTTSLQDTITASTIFSKSCSKYQMRLSSILPPATLPLYRLSTQRRREYVIQSTLQE